MPKTVKYSVSLYVFKNVNNLDGKFFFSCHQIEIVSFACIKGIDYAPIDMFCESSIQQSANIL